MATKQFKIGEYAIGGIIKVTIEAKSVTIQALNMYSGDKEEIKSKVLMTNNTGAMLWYLEDLTSAYYASKVMDWIYSKI